MNHHIMFRCVCGKAAYPSKRVAKQFRQYRHRDDSRLRVYHCDEGITRVWHLGHQTETRDFYRGKKEI